MELHERISRPFGASGEAHDPFSELKNRVHLALINDLGPQLFGVGTDPLALRQRVEADLRDRLQNEAGLSRDDRERLLAEIADDVLGYGPLERLLADDTVSEIMVNGAHRIWVERQGRLS
jgi:pilus assembly protein CpaF